MIVLTSAQLLQLRKSCAGDPATWNPAGHALWSDDDRTLWNACNAALWHVDRNGELRGYHTDAGDRVRAAAVARGLVTT